MPPSRPAFRPAPRRTRCATATATARPDGSAPAVSAVTSSSAASFSTCCRADRGRGDRRAAARTQDLPAVSPRTADLHPHPCSGTGHGAVIRRPLTRRRPIPPPRAPARHSTGLTFMPPMAVAMTRTTPTAIPNASRRTIIPRPNASPPAPPSVPGEISIVDHSPPTSRVRPTEFPRRLRAAETLNSLAGT